MGSSSSRPKTSNPQGNRRHSAPPRAVKGGTARRTRSFSVVDDSSQLQAPPEPTNERPRRQAYDVQQLSKEGAKYLQRRDLEEARQNVKDAKRVTKAVRKELKVLKKNTAGRVDGEQTMRQVETELSLAKHWEKRAKREATRIFGEDGVLAAVIVQGGSPGIR